jgi:hypothetical protein
MFGWFKRTKKDCEEAENVELFEAIEEHKKLQKDSVCALDENLEAISDLLRGKSDDKTTDRA